MDNLNESCSSDIMNDRDNDIHGIEELLRNEELYRIELQLDCPDAEQIDISEFDDIEDLPDLVSYDDNYQPNLIEPNPVESNLIEPNLVEQPNPVEQPNQVEPNLEQPNPVEQLNIMNINEIMDQNNEDNEFNLDLQIYGEVNDIISAFENTGVYHCPRCNIVLTKTIFNDDGQETTINVEPPDVYEHIRLHYLQGDNMTRYACDICAARFGSEYVFNTHMANHIDRGDFIQQNNQGIINMVMNQLARHNNNDEEESEDDEDEDDEDDEDEDDEDDEDEDDYDGNGSEYEDDDEDDEDDDNRYGNYACRVCGREYSDEYSLGEHFISRHGSYDMLSNLSARRQAAFPGFKFLVEKSMIRYVTGSELKNSEFMSKYSDMCSICYETYTEPIEKNDTDVLTGSTNNDTRVLTESTNNDTEVNKPLLLLCCSQLICTSCITNHIKQKGALLCPYCNKNHCPIEINEENDESEENENENANTVNVVANRTETFLRSLFPNLFEIAHNINANTIVNNNEHPNHSGYEPPTINQALGNSEVIVNNQLSQLINNTENNNDDVDHMAVFPAEYLPFAGIRSNNYITSQSVNPVNNQRINTEFKSNNPYFANDEQINYIRTMLSRNNNAPQQNNIAYPNALTINEFRGSINQLRDNNDNNQYNDDDIEEVD
jgi:hypothetical protein